jgi:hypothetical protein
MENFWPSSKGFETIHYLATYYLLFKHFHESYLSSKILFVTNFCYFEGKKKIKKILVFLFFQCRMCFFSAKNSHFWEVKELKKENTPYVTSKLLMPDWDLEWNVGRPRSQSGFSFET